MDEKAKRKRQLTRLRVGIFRAREKGDDDLVEYLEGQRNKVKQTSNK